MPRLKRSDPTGPGITRRRRGKGWAFQNPDGSAVDAETRTRILALVIPPAWRDVWISPHANGHIQVIGSDEAGRRQYMYHEGWTTRRHAMKFVRVIDFAAGLPKARTAVSEHLALSGMPKERALATAFRLLDLGHFRIGGDVYAETNGSFGLSTLRRDHVRRRGSSLIFEYVAKSGLDHIERISDDDLLDSVGAMMRRRSEGEELLAYKNGRSWHRIAGSDINAYIKEVIGKEVSAKDFRTWHGTGIAAVVLSDEYREHPADKDWTKTATKKAITRAITETSARLGNTPAVCRGSYVDPRVLENFENGTVIDRAVAKARRELPEPGAAEDEIVRIAGHPTVERAVLKMLRG